jgi:glycosyltransferase involved in cell wall biosynthesis
VRPDRLTVLHLTASPCYGGSERQMLELGRELQGSCRSVYASFLEEGRCWDFVREATRQGFSAHAISHDTPRLVAVYRELTALLSSVRADLLCCHGYKANLLGLFAARRLGIPVIAVSHGWTGESLRVRLFERLDRCILRWMDKVVCVSEAQAQKVRQAGVRPDKVVVIRDAVRPERFDNPDPAFRERLLQLFCPCDRDAGSDTGNPSADTSRTTAVEPAAPQDARPDVVICAAGRLSPEKGFSVLIDAAAIVLKSRSVAFGADHDGAGCHVPPSSCAKPSATRSIGFVLFGDGVLRQSLTRQIAALGLENRFILAGFHQDLDRYLPHCDLFVQSSFTEGLPNVVLEACAAGVPVVATAVGGTPEVVEDGVNGCLVESGDPAALTRRIVWMAWNDGQRRNMGACGQQTVRERFSFLGQARQYGRLFNSLLSSDGRTRSLTAT